MQFNSYIFILLFLPVMFAGYFALNKINYTVGKIFVVLMSAAFFAYSGWKSSIVLAVSVICNYFFVFLLQKVSEARKFILFADIFVNVGLLLYFKYFNFLITNINQFFKAEISMQELILPLGISFFTFQQIAYIVNVYKGKLERLPVVDYLLYILYFPKLIMGPIVEPEVLLTQFNDSTKKKINMSNVASGARVFSYGLFKKMLLADTFALAVNWGFDNLKAATSMDLILVVLAYTFEIYFDFSGYSDMAVGISQMLNIELPINFNSPYKAISIRDFWKRWHMSLTGFLTKYVYFPLGGSKKGTARTYINTMIVFLVSGIWHGANWTFILWGILHGALSVFDRVFDKYQSKLTEAVRWLATFSTVNVLWLLFRAESISQWLEILKKILLFNKTSVSSELIKCFTLPESNFIIDALHLSYLDEHIRGLSLLIFFAAAFIICLVPENNYKTKNKITYAGAVAAAIAFIWGFLCLSTESVFVYFNF